MSQSLPDNVVNNRDLLSVTQDLVSPTLEAWRPCPFDPLHDEKTRLERHSDGLAGLAERAALLEEDCFNAFSELICRPICVIKHSSLSSDKDVHIEVNLYDGLSDKAVALAGKAVSSVVWVLQKDNHYQVVFPAGDVHLACHAGAGPSCGFLMLNCVQPAARQGGHCAMLSCTS